MSARGDRRGGKVKPACGFGNRAALENRYETLDVSDVNESDSSTPDSVWLTGRAGRVGRSTSVADVPTAVAAGMN